MTRILQSPHAVQSEPPPTPPIELRDRCTPEFLAGMMTDPGLGAFSHYAPQAAERQRAALVKVAGLPQCRVLVAHRGRDLVAYLTLHPPGPDSRWAALPGGQVLELGGIEVARGLRGRGLAGRLMDLAFSSPDLNAVIVIAQALTWCWDLKGTGKGKAEYRQMMLRLFRAHGFEPHATDEPNIRQDRANLLLVRTGPAAPGSSLHAFKATLIQQREEW